jgi:hypothetical protein
MTVTATKQHHEMFSLLSHALFHFIYAALCHLLIFDNRLCIHPQTLDVFAVSPTSNFQVITDPFQKRPAFLQQMRYEQFVS